MSNADRPPVDLRLLPATGGAWLAAWLTPAVPRWVAGFAAACLLVAAGWARHRFVVASMLLVCSAVVASTLGRVVLLEQDPVAALAAAGREVVVTGTVTADPQWSDHVGFGSAPQRQIRAEVRVGQISVPSQSWQVRLPFVVMGDGDGWNAIRFGAKVRLSGVLSQEQGTRPVAAVLFIRGPPEVLAPPPLLLRGAEQMRAGLRDAVAGTPPDVRGLLPALVVGDTSHLPPQLVDDLRTSGLTHLTAVSGANVAIVLIATLFAARFVRIRGYWIPTIGLLTVSWFVFLARPQPSVLRAAVMGALAVVAVLTSANRQGPRLLLAAVLLLLLIDPWLARSWGFALSVAATAGLLALAGRWSRALSRRWPRVVAEAVGVALAAQVTTLPLSVALSGQLALLSVPANVLAAPAVAPATVLGASAAAVSPVAPRLASVLAWLAQWPTAWIVTVAHHTATAPMASWPWPDGWFGGLAALVAIALLAVGVHWCRRRRWLRGRRCWLAIAAVLVLVLAFIRGPGRWPPPGWLIAACDVGQGDAIVVSAGAGTALVVDAGPASADVDRCLDQLGVRQIPLLVLTHFHADHVMGMPGVLDGRYVGTVLVSPFGEPAEQAAEVSGWSAGRPVVVAQPGQSGVINGVTWSVLWPLAIIRGQGSDPNNASVVLLVETHGFRLLLTGDIEPAAQHALALASDNLSADVIKVPHHGSRYQDPLFWQEVSPRLALVSVGEGNTYGHPDPQLLSELAAAGIVVARTDTQGTAVVVDDGGLRVVTQR